MVLESCNIQMRIGMKEIGWEVKNMVKEHISMLMEQNIKGNGEMRIKMDKEYFII